MDIGMFLQVAGYQLPSLLISAVLIVLAVIRFSSAPRVFSLLIIGAALIILNNMLGLVHPYIVINHSAWNWSVSEMRIVLGVLGMVQVILFSGGLILVGAAAFVDRKRVPPSGSV